MGELHILRDLVVIFGAALAVVLLLGRLGLPSIGGFILAGALLGPSGLGWVASRGQIEQLAEVGVALLLFTIGLELSPSELRRLGTAVAFGGAAQVGLTTAVVAWLAVLLGVPTAKAVFLGFLVALSSTAIVLKGLAERGETDAPHGRLTVGVLLFQDLAVVPMMLVTPFLAGGGLEGPGVARLLLVSAAVIGATLLLALKAVPRVLHVVAETRRRDLFVLGVVLIVAGMAWLTSVAGLSPALGAFLAGALLAGSEHGHQALADVLPQRDIFTSLFFVSMGMLLDAQVLLAQPQQVVGLAAALLVGKAALATLAGLVLGAPLRVALLAGIALSQVGEFSFVLAALGERLGLLGGAELRPFLAVGILTMLVTPFALRVGPAVAFGATRLPALSWLGRAGDELGGRAAEGLRDHVVVLGYGVGGEMLTEVLERAQVPHVAVDINAGRVRQARQEGQPLHYGDVTSPAILERVGVPRARQVAVMLNDPDATIRAVRAARRLAPGAPILVRARYVAEVPRLLAAGATEAVAQEFEASLELIERAMKDLAVAAPGRPERERMEGLRPRLPAGLEVESVPVGPHAWIAGRSLADAGLRARTGATLVAVSRAGMTTHPEPDQRLETGDVLCLVGSGPQIAGARRLIESGPAD
jgi:CPA2 family monovalent cation:H+ antiporter-2